MRTLTYISLLSAFILSSCSETEHFDNDMMESFAGDVSLEVEKTTHTQTPTTKEPEAPTKNNTRIKRKVIKTISLNFEVKKVEDCTQHIEQTAKKYGAYITSSKLVNNSHHVSNNITLRVKPEVLEAMVKDILSGAVYIQQKDLATKDVTEEYVDIMARLKNKKEVEKQYLKLLQKAKNIEEILIIKDKVRYIREEIEAKEGRLKYLTDQIAYSTIHLTYYEKSQPTSLGPQKTFLSQMEDGFAGGWSLVLQLLIGISYLWPFIITGLLIGFLVKKRWLKK